MARAEVLAAQLRTEGHEADAVALDLSDPRSVKLCAATLMDRFDRLDVLINNSSSVPDFGAHGIFDADVEQIRAAWATNVAGPWQLTQALLPLLRSAAAARIVNVSSPDALQVSAGTDFAGDMTAPAFSIAKFTMNAMTASFAAALRDTPILVNAADPGTTATHPETGDEGAARPAAESAHGIVWAATLPAGGPTGGFFRDSTTV